MSFTYISDSDDEAIAGPSRYPSSATQRPAYQNFLDDDSDFATSALIGTLSLADAESSLEEVQKKGKRRFDAPLTDAEFALLLQTEEIQRFQTASQDTHFAQNLAMVETTATTPPPSIDMDAEARLEAFAIMEKAAEDDHRAAQMLAQGLPLPPLTENQRRMEDPEIQRLLSFDSDPEPPRVTTTSSPNVPFRPSKTTRPLSNSVQDPTRSGIKPILLPNFSSNRARKPTEEGFVMESDLEDDAFGFDTIAHPPRRTASSTTRRGLPEPPRPTANVKTSPSVAKKTPLPRAIPPTNSEQDDEEAFLKAVSTFASSKDKSPQTRPTARTSGSSTAPVADNSLKVECIACMDTFPARRTIHMPCDHYYCRPCFIEWIENFLKDETLYPLRCCQKEIPLDDLSTFLSEKPKLRRDFRDKVREYSVPTRNRLYCCNPRCSTFLGSTDTPPDGIDQRTGIICEMCETATCPRCKEEGHLRSGDCQVNRSIESLKALAAQEGWQTCPGCSAIVELHHGCYHMTCLCRAQFCYVCAVPWKECLCPQWDEERLLVTARQRVENDIGVDAVRQTRPAILEEIVRNRAENLRSNHGDCNPHRWHYRFGTGQCEHCFWDAPKFIYVCNSCSMLACLRCSRNRL